MATKVGEGYIEIRPKLVGFSRQLIRDARSRIRELEDATVTVKPQISGITKAWQESVQRQLNEKIKGLTVDVKVKLENDSLKATFNDFTVEAKAAGTKGGEELSAGFKRYIGDIHKEINKANIALKSGFKFADDPAIQQSVKKLQGEFQELAEAADDMSREQVRAVNIAANSWKTLSNMVERETSKATKDFERYVEQTGRAADRLAETVKFRMGKAFDNVDNVWGIASSLEQEIRDAELIADALFPDLEDRVTGGMVDPFKKAVQGIQREMREIEIAIQTGFRRFDDAHVTDAMSRIDRAIKDLARDTSQYSDEQVNALKKVTAEHQRLSRFLESESQRSASEFERAFERMIRATDRLAERIKVENVAGQGLNRASGVWNIARSLEQEVRDAEGIVDALFPDLNDRIAEYGRRGGTSFGNRFVSALRSNFFDNVTEGILSLAAQFGALLVAAPPLISAIGNLTAGLVELGSVVVDVEGSMAALPAVWAATAQASITLTAAFWGIQDALTALGNEDQAAARAIDTQAAQIKNAQERVADAKERLKRVYADADADIEAAEKALAQAQEDAARRIEEAQSRLADAHEAAAEAIEAAEKRVADAQQALSRAYESAADRIAAAEKRHEDAIKRVRDAQQDLTQAYEDAKERLEDLNIQLANSVLDEEGAKLGIERAKERLDQVMADPEASDLDKREAEHAYREALQRLNEIQERNADLRKEVEQATKEGIEGSKEVTSAKEKLLEAQQAEIEAQKDLARAYRDASDQIAEAQQRVADAQADVAKAQEDASKRILEAEKAVADARAEAAERIKKAQEDESKARLDNARAIADAQKAVKRALEDLADAQKKQTAQTYNAQYAMSQLSPEAQKFVNYLNDTFIPELQKVQFHIQDAFYPPIKAALEKSGGLLDLFDEKLTTSAGLFGTLIANTITWLETPEARNQLGKILDTNNRLFGLLGEAGQNFGKVLLTMAEEAGPFIESMGKLVLDFSEWLDKVVNSKEGREELADFFDRVEKTIRLILDILKPLGRSLYDIYKQVEPYATELLDYIKKTAERFEDWVNSPEGKTKLERFFENGERFLESIFGLVEDVAKAFFEWASSEDMSTVVDAIKDDLLPALSDLMTAMGGGSDAGGFVFIIKVVSTALNIFTTNLLLVALAFSLLAGDMDGAKATIVRFLEVVQNQGEIVLGNKYPEFAEKSRQNTELLIDTIKRTMSDGGASLDGFGTATEETASRHGRAMDEIAKRTDEMSGRIDGSTADARDKVKTHMDESAKAASQSAKDMQESVSKHAEDLARNVAKSTEDMKRDSGQKIHDLNSDAQSKFRDMLLQISTIVAPMPTVFARIISSVKDEFNRNGPSWISLGRGIVQGLIDGIGSLASGLIGAITRLAQDAINAARGVFDSHSPSKVFIGIGEDVGEGLTIGINNMVGRAVRATKTLAESVVSSFDTPALNVEVGVTGRKAVPTIGTTVQPVSLVGGARNINYITVHAAPTVPTERQISNILKYQDALYG